MSIESRGAWDGAATGRAGGPPIGGCRAGERGVRPGLRRISRPSSDRPGPGSRGDRVHEWACAGGRGNPTLRSLRLRRGPSGVPLLGAGDVPGGAIDVERGEYKDGENLLCKVADPKRSDTTTPVFADENSSRSATSRVSGSDASRTSRGVTTTRATTTTWSLVTPTASPRRSTRPRPRGTRRRTTTVLVSCSTSLRGSGPPPLPGRGVGARRLGGPCALSLRGRRQEARYVSRALRTRPGCSPTHRGQRFAMRGMLEAVHSGSDAGGVGDRWNEPGGCPHHRGPRSPRSRVRPRPAASRRPRARGIRSGLRRQRHRRHAADLIHQRRGATSAELASDDVRRARDARAPSRAWSTSSPISRVPCTRRGRSHCFGNSSPS